MALRVALPSLGWKFELKNLRDADGAEAQRFLRCEEIDFKVVAQIPLVNVILNEFTNLRPLINRFDVARTDHLGSVSGYTVPGK